MVVQVNIPLSGDANSFITPSTAVLNSTTGVFVIKVTGGKMTWVPVQTGRTSNNQTEVFGKLAGGYVVNYRKRGNEGWGTGSCDKNR